MNVVMIVTDVIFVILFLTNIIYTNYINSKHTKSIKDMENFGKLSNADLLNLTVRDLLKYVYELQGNVGEYKRFISDKPSVNVTINGNDFDEET